MRQLKVNSHSKEMLMVLSASFPVCLFETFEVYFYTDSTIDSNIERAKGELKPWKSVPKY